MYCIVHIRAGEIRLSAMTTLVRTEVLPDIPTVAEFLPDYETTPWFGVGAPKNTPAEIFETLNKDINGSLADHKMKTRLADLGGLSV